jgi:hypothetical protein
MVVAGLFRQINWGHTSRASAVQAASRIADRAALAVLNIVKMAIIGVVAARLKDYVGTIFPGFREHDERAARATIQAALDMCD